MRANQIIPDKNISMLLKAPFGYGKTCAACSFAIFGDVYLAYFDKRTPVELVGFFSKLGRKGLLDKIEVDSFSSGNAGQYLEKVMKLQKEPGRYTAIITDSVTNVTTSSMNWSLGFRPPENKKEAKERKLGELNLIPGFSDYKVETSLITQALDLMKMMPGYIIFTAHPLPKLEISGVGDSMVITKTSQIVSYGQKVGAMIPGSFNEIYQFGRQGGRRVVFTDLVGDDYAKTAFNLPQYFDITDRLFAEVWKEEMDKALSSGKEVSNEVVERTADSDNILQPQVTTSPATKEGATKWKV